MNSDFAGVIILPLQRSVEERMNMQEKILKSLDTEYSYRLARRMEDFRTNAVLGYRTAGSQAEFDTGEMIKAEMETLGLSDVRKDAVTVDGWEFKKAVLSFRDESGEMRKVQLGAYQTNFVTDGPEQFSLVFLGKGAEADYVGRDVRGKLVLVDVNQRDEWWINFPVYQAHLKGARALIAAQSGGYGEIDDEALNAQDIAGPEDAAAFSISRKDAAVLKTLLKTAGEIPVWLDADTRVKRNCTTYNITGCIPGRHPDRMVLLSAHYDSYFSGFQDDNSAVAMMLGIARAFLTAQYQPENTLLFCAMAAEEWGVADSNFDWSAGAYEEVFTAHPEWVGKAIANINFELPALAHGTRARIRSCYEYVRYLESFLTKLPKLTEAYPEPTRITAPIETWSDDFTIAIAGIPSMVNDFTGGSFMETHYHSQFDNNAYYDEKVYRLHHELFALLMEALDHTAVAPLCFSPVMLHAMKGGGAAPAFVGKQIRDQLARFAVLLHHARERAEREYEEITDVNARYACLLDEGRLEEAERVYQASRELEVRVLKKFRAEQDAFVRMDWYGNVLYPHEILLKNLRLLWEAICSLREGELRNALRQLYQVDNNAYAFTFDEDVYRHFTDYVLRQPKSRLKWGYGRLVEHENLYGLVRALLEKQKAGKCDYAEEIGQLERVCDRQRTLLSQVVDTLCRALEQSFL